MQNIKNAHRSRQSHSAQKAKKLPEILSQNSLNIVLFLVGIIAIVAPICCGVVIDNFLALTIAYGGCLIGLALSGVMNRD